MDRNAKIISISDYRRLTYILRCKDCGSNAFFIWLNSKNPYDFKMLECAECGSLFMKNEDG